MSLRADGAGLLPLLLLCLAAAGSDAPEAASTPVSPGASPVADAAQRGDLGAVRDLLRGGADVNAPQGDGMTALHWAAERGDEVLCEVLLYAGARVDAGTRIGHYTPLHLAARAASVPVIEMLLGAGSDPGAATTNSGATPLHLAAAAGDPRVIEVLAGAGADVNAREAAWGQTPLIFAAAANRVAAIDALLAAGADPSLPSHVVDVEEQADADAAAERRLNEFIAAFREKEGGGPEWQPTPSQVQAAIEAAREIQRRWPDVPDPADDNAEDEEEGEGEGEAEAAQEGLADQEGQVAGEAVEASGEPPDSAEAATDSAQNTQNTQITQNADSAEAEDAEEEEEEPRPLSYAQTVGGWGGLTPLLHAVRQGHTQAALALLAGGADIDQPSAGDGTTPLLMAAVNGQFDLAAVLLERGAAPNLASQAGTTPLYAVLERQWAPRASYSHPTEHLHQNTTHLELLEALLDAGADPNARLESHLWYMEYTFGVLRGSGINLKGATPFWRAAYALDVDAMRLLKDHGADPSLATVRPPQRRRRQASADEGRGRAAGPLRSAAGAERRAIDPPHSRGVGRRLRPVLRGQRPPPRPRQLDGRGALPGRGVRRRRERARRQRRHPAPPRRFPGRHRDDLLPHRPRRRCHRPEPPRPDGRGHGQRADSARAAVPGHGRASGKAGVEEQPPLPGVLSRANRSPPPRPPPPSPTRTPPSPSAGARAEPASTMSPAARAPAR